MRKEEMFKAHIDDLVIRAEKYGIACTGFLTPAEAAGLGRRFANRRDLSLTFDGGFKDAERRIAIFTMPDYAHISRDDMLTALSMDYRRQDQLSHRDILGAALSLGIRREAIGDIAADSNPVIMICLSNIARFIMDNLRSAGRVGLTVTQMALNSLPEITRNIRRQKDTVASLRLDAILSSAFRISRKDAVSYIQTGRVQLKHQECLNTSAAVQAGDIFSIKGLGRATLLETGGISKKGRQWVVIGVYE